mgnify:FL=1
MLEAAKEGRLDEAFGTGTAAVISPIGELRVGDENYIINNNETGEISHRLYEAMTGMQYGKIEDKFGWTEGID